METGKIHNYEQENHNQGDRAEIQICEQEKYIIGNRRNPQSATPGLKYIIVDRGNTSLGTAEIHNCEQGEYMIVNRRNA